ncbi:hypothetical protein [Halostella pelagica]|uniref:hypothetical protein n=1 Tax=Halostella pelagica TaxID=2583824 RepID=UPI0010818673|nr:hypothetical protein [Halostella pelagica]
MRPTEDVPEENDENVIEKRSDGLPYDVSSTATVTIKETNGNHYDYWQWRDGDSVPSLYNGRSILTNREDVVGRGPILSIRTP